jgi:LPXTG-motif cell wall-anchored protein
LRAWFYPGDNFGQAFPYPKHPQVLEASATAPATVNNGEPVSSTANNAAEANREVTPAGSKPPAEATSQTAPAQEDQAALAQQNQTPAAQQNQTAAEQQAAGEADRSQTEEQTQIAQNNPPPAPAQQETQRPAELPKTASPYGLIGLAGVALLGLAGLLRLRRIA